MIVVVVVVVVAGNEHLIQRAVWTVQFVVGD